MPPVKEAATKAPQTSVTGCPDFDYAQGQPNLYLMMRFKQDLVARFGLERGFERYRQKFALPEHVALRPAAIESERAFAGGKAEVFAETAPAGEAFLHEPPTIIGESNHRQVKGTTRSQYVACLRNVQVQGRSALLEVDGRVLLDCQDDEAGRLDDELDWDPAIFHAKGRQAWCIGTADASHPMEVEEAFSLLGAHTDFFGHWMSEYLPKYVAARLSGLVPPVPILIDSHMPRSHLESLELMYGDSVRMIEVPAFRTVRVRKLWCAPTLMYMPLHEMRNDRFSWDAVTAAPCRFEPVICEMQKRVDANSRASGTSRLRVFLARKSFRHRKLVNSESIEQMAMAAGFQIVYPEALPFAEQAALMHNAEYIIAPEGSAIFLSFFAKLGAKLCILSHPLTDVLADYNGLLGAHGVKITALSGPITRLNRSTPHDSDYQIDEETFRRFVHGWIENA